MESLVEHAGLSVVVVKDEPSAVLSRVEACTMLALVEQAAAVLRKALGEAKGASCQNDQMRV